MSAADGQHDARVQVLTAEVRTLVVGSRQVTLSVYNQLDEIGFGDIEPFGRVNPKGTLAGWVYVIGREKDTGTLARSATPSSARALRDGRETYLHKIRELFPSVLYSFLTPSYRKLLSYAGEAEDAAGGIQAGSLVRLFLLSDAITAYASAVNRAPMREVSGEEKTEWLECANVLIKILNEELSAVSAWSELDLIVLAGLR